MKSDATQTPETTAGLPYRPCVGIMLLNAQGRVWVGRRIPKWEGDGSDRLWQMPQGGIDAGESPEQAARREMLEEIGTGDADILGQTKDWLAYDLPADALGVALKGRYCGQKQMWFAMRFTGTDADIDIDPRQGHPAEFDAWKWVGMRDLPELVVAFKRPVYEAVVAEFSRFA